MFSRFPFSYVVVKVLQRSLSLLRRLPSISAAHPPVETKTARRRRAASLLPRFALRRLCYAFCLRVVSLDQAMLAFYLLLT